MDGDQEYEIGPYIVWIRPILFDKEELGDLIIDLAIMEGIYV
jgi:hypothetical protein